MNNQLSQPAEVGTAILGSGAAAPLNFQQLLNRCLGNLALAERLLSNFEDRFGDDLSRLQEGLQTNNSQLVARVAHQLKGASANLAAAGLQRITAEIEGLGRADRLEEVDGLLDQLRGEWQRFTEFRAASHEFAGRE
jgi:HPt (histidine-containing phosphotransfer) domain-containing protein